MICYRDMTFCTERTCKNFGPCPRSLTDEVHQDAWKWWGSHDYPIAIFADKPDCYDPVIIPQDVTNSEPQEV